MSVPVVDVHSENLVDIWPSLLLAVRSATFVAVDTELSGLGNRKLLNAKSVDDRFKAVSHIAKTRSVVSLGLSCYKLTNHSSASSEDAGLVSEAATNEKPCVSEFMVQTFNITVLCQEEYVVEPTALQFLVDHGFDFNKQYSKGIPYYKGEDQTGKKVVGADMRNLFSELITGRIPLVFHNALIDLVFLYETFYAPLPLSLGMFLADLSEMFEGGVFDTKYIAEFAAHYPASYLDYVFHKSQRENESDRISGSSCVTLTFPPYPQSYDHVTFGECAVLEESDKKPIHPEILQAMKPLICAVFAAHGWCPSARHCTKSHDINLILDSESVCTKKKSRKRNRKRRRCDHTTENSEETERMETGEMTDNATGDASEEKPDEHICNIDSAEVANENSADTSHSENSPSDSVTQHVTPEVNDIYKNRNRGHRAGFDAFMTGFAMATFIKKYATTNFSSESPPSIADLGLDSLLNKVFLSGKDIPLSITKSSFTKTSKQHNEKLKRLLQAFSST